MKLDFFPIFILILKPDVGIGRVRRKQMVMLDFIFNGITKVLLNILMNYLFNPFYWNWTIFVEIEDVLIRST
jgi:hypothetical protein